MTPPEPAGRLVWTVTVRRPMSRIVAESAPIERRGDLADSPPSLASRRLDVRLLRGYTGSAPADALVGETFLGAGGGSAIADVRARLRGTLPFVDYALLGRWQGRGWCLDRAVGTD